MTPLLTSKTTRFGPLYRDELKRWPAWALMPSGGRDALPGNQADATGMHGRSGGGASSQSVSTATKRTGLNIILALDHAAVGRERVVVPDDGSQIRLSLDY